MSQIQLIERLKKETDESVAVEGQDFLRQPIQFLKENIHEYVFIEEDSLNSIRVDGLVFEYDEMFEVYTALFGLKLQKKMGITLKNFFNDNLKHITGASSAMFSAEDGLWEVNIALDAISSFNHDGTIEQAYEVFYQFVADLLLALEQEK